MTPVYPPRPPVGMRSDLLWFVGLRLLSGSLSFLLFALLARWFDADQTKSLYYFLFLAGFFTSALRALATISAALKGSESRSVKLRRACHSFGQVVCVSIVMLPIALWVFVGLQAPPWVYGGLLVLLVSWGLDIDVVRAIVGRSSLVAVANVAGAIIALACLAAFRTYEVAFAAILLQWLPLCGLNAYVLFRLRRRIQRGVRATLARLGGSVWAPLAVSLFDGLVINAPFFLSDQTPTGVGRSVGVVTRIFVAALILMPLVTYWSNSGALSRLAARIGLSVPLIFAGLAAASGLVAGSAFAAAFAWIASVAPSTAELAAATLLLLGYSAFASAGRYRAGHAPHLSAWLSALVGASILGVLATLRLGMGALGVATVQAATLLAAAALMTLLRR